MSLDTLPIPYDEFRPIVTNLKTNTSNATYLGGGAESSVWRITLDGTDYAIKLVNEYSPRGRRRDIFKAVETKIKTGLRGLGIPGLEQLRSASPEDGAVIYEYVNGIKASEMTEENIKNITPEHVAALYKTISAATQAGIQLDGWNDEGDNALFNVESGFTLIDYWAADGNISVEQNRLFAIRSLGAAGLSIATNAIYAF